MQSPAESLRQFQNYTAFRNVSDEQVAKLFKVLMVEQAVDWIDSLLPPPEGQKANLEYFVQNFRQRYQTPETLMMKTVQELYSRQQQQEELVHGLGGFPCA